jgi:hypothetical protein
LIEVGKEASLRIPLARLGTALLEFIEPEADAANVWSDTLRRRRPGVHHVAFTQVENYEQSLENMQAMGFDLTVAGHFGVDRWCYLETADLVLELANGAGPVFPEDEEQRR